MKPAGDRSDLLDDAVVRFAGSINEVQVSHFRPVQEALPARGYLVKRQTPDPYFVASGWVG